MRILYLHSPSPLKYFAESCFTLTPKVFVHGAQEVFLDIESTEKFFGGEKKILDRIAVLKVQFKLEISEVLTDRPEWARALATDHKVHLPKGKSFSALTALSVERLLYCGDPAKLEEEKKERERLIQFMKRVGLKTICDFVQLTSTAVGRRFGRLGVQIKQWLLGEKNLILPLFQPEEKITEFLDTEDIGDREALILSLEPLFSRIELRLRGRIALAQELKFTFYLEDKNQKESLRLTEAANEAKDFARATKEYLSRAQWESPIKGLEIEVSDLIPHHQGQLSLFSQTENRSVDLEKYVARLRSRIGEKEVGFAELKESYLPERSWKTVLPPLKPQLPSPQYFSCLRPPLLYSPPKPYLLSRNAKLMASENLAAEWWAGGGYRRYFIAQTPDGDRLWVFWDTQQQQWFLQGSFD